jgi:membrane protein implicated in regulation of membrane protease activity
MKLTQRKVLALVLVVSCALAGWPLYPRLREYQENQRLKAAIGCAGKVSNPAPQPARVGKA